jgi:zinc transport system permease protein
MATTITTSRTPMPDDFLIRVTLAAAGVALAAGPLGCFVLWRRMVYFGDTVSHAALLGVALALATDLPVTLGVLAVALAAALVILGAGGRSLGTDTLLGVTAHSALALGLVAVSLMQGVRVNLMSYLIGDILAVGWIDVAVIWGGGLLCLGLLVWRWRRLLLATLDRDMALSRGIGPGREGAIYTLALALMVAVAIKVVGALLITALLILPAATGRLGATTPERMAVAAALAGLGAAFGGLLASFRFDTPTGPTIVVAALAILIAAASVGTVRSWRRSGVSR